MCPFFSEPLSLQRGMKPIRIRMYESPASSRQHGTKKPPSALVDMLPTSRRDDRDSSVFVHLLKEQLTTLERRLEERT